MKSKFYLPFITLSAALLIGGALRFYRLADFPVSLYWDEVSIAYNAYSILETGKSEFGLSFPFWFEAFGEYKLPVYIYLTVASIKVFGATDFAVRFPSALAGTLTILGMYTLVFQLFSQQKKIKSHLMAGIAAFLFAISPWSLQFSRAGFEATVALALIVFGMAALVRAFHKRKRTWLIISGLLLVLSMATYNAGRLFIPLFLFGYCLIYKKRLLQMRTKVLSAFAIVTVLSVPVIFAQFSEKGLVRATATTILGDQGPVKTFSRLVGHYADNFNWHYLFFHGDLIGRHSVKRLGMMYYFSAVFIFFGFISLKKISPKIRKFILLWLFLAPLPVILTTPSPHALRSLHILPAWVMLSSLGAYYLIIEGQKRFSKKVFSLIAGFSILVMVYNVAIYLGEYYVTYRKMTALDWGDGNREAILAIKNRAKEVDAIYISDELGFPYLAFYLPLEPTVVHQVSDHYEKNLPSFGKVSYFQNVWDLPQKDETRIIIAPWWQKPPAKIESTKIYLENGDLHFNIWEERARSQGI